VSIYIYPEAGGDVSPGRRGAASLVTELAFLNFPSDIPPNPLYRFRMNGMAIASYDPDL
jgi:hypothetical protein